MIAPIHGYPASAFTGTCGELVPAAERPHGRVLGAYCYCDRPSDGVRVTGLPSGRRDVRAGPYCREHGGLQRAEEEAGRDWSVLAPASVGDDGAVLVAGNLALDSRDSCITVREIAASEAAEQPERWHAALTREAHAALLATLGERGRRSVGWAAPVRTIGADWRVQVRLLGWWLGRLPGHQAGQPATDEEIAALADVLTLTHEPARERSPLRWESWVGIGGFMESVGRSSTAAEAIERAEAHRRERTAARIEEIRRARGGSLAWGLAVELRDDPIIVRPRPGESSWDAYGRMEER